VAPAVGPVHGVAAVGGAGVVGVDAADADLGRLGCSQVFRSAGAADPALDLR
jgi:hypothetical protein